MRQLLKYTFTNNSERKAIVYMMDDGTQRIWRYEQLLKEVEQLEVLLQTVGVRKIDRISIY